MPEDPTDQAGREYSYSDGWRLLTRAIVPPVVKTLMKRDWHGHEQLPRDGGMILAPNHLSYADWGAVALFSYEAGRYPSFLIKSAVFDVKGIGRLLRGCGQFPVYRGQADAALVLRDAEAALRQGACLVVYPEGTATRDPDLWPMTARTGVARLALSTGAPVIPVAHWGAQLILPYGEKKPRLWPRQTVHLVAGPPVDLSAFDGAPLNARTLRAATETVMRAITELLAGLRGEQPPDTPYDPRARRRASAAGPDTPAVGAETPAAGPDAPAAGPDTPGETATGKAGPA